jgi:heterodisulfide reductase subunit C
MYETIEAIYEDGKIIPLNDELKVKKAKVFLTIVEEMEESEPQGVPLNSLMQFKGLFKKFPEGLKYQKELRDEW